MRASPENRPAVRIAVIYTAVGLLWILLSDLVLSFLDLDSRARLLAEVAKGSGFVLITGALIFFLVRGALRERIRTEERFRHLFENLPIGVYRVTPDGEILDANPALCDLLGCPDVETLRRTPAWRFFVDEADRHRWLEQFGRDDVVTDFETQLRRWDGEIVHVLDNARAVRDADGRLQYVEGSLEDVSGRHRAEEALRETKEALQAIIEASPLALMTLDAEGRVGGVWNRAAERMFGWRHDEVEGKPLPFIPEGYEEEHLRLRERVLSGEAFEAVEVRRLKRDGTPIDISVSTAPLRDREGRVTGIMALVEDITRRARNQAERQRMIDILEATSDFVGISTPDGRILYSNRGAREMIGVGDAETERLSVTDIIPERLHETWFHEVLPTARREGTWEGEGVFVDVEGGEHLVSLVVIIHEPPEGGDPYVSTIARDLTRQRELEEQLRQAQKLEAVGRLTGGIAHDFNNLLTIIQTNADLIGQTVQDETLQGSFDDLFNAVDRGRDLTRRLLIFSRREELDLRPVDIVPLVERYAATLRRLLPETIDVRVRIEDAVPPVLCDPGALEQSLLNLAMNARDAMPSGGSMEIAVCRAERDAPDPDEGETAEWVRISVRDDGSGMEVETQRRVFEPFFTTKGPDQGTGLGLSMVYGIMQLHRGGVSLQSREGEGTEVWLDLPLAPAGAGVPGEARPSASLPGGGETILVVEDEPAVRRALERALTRLGYRVLLAADGVEGLEVYGAHRDRVDLVLSDVVMPRLGGQGLYAAVLDMEAEGEGESAPFLFMSGYTSREVSDQQGLDARLPLLQKPWTLPELAHRIRAVLDGAVPKAAASDPTARQGAP